MCLLKSRYYYVICKQTELSSWPGFLIIDGGTFIQLNELYFVPIILEPVQGFVSQHHQYCVLIQLNQKDVNMYYLICSQSADAFDFESISQCESNVFFHITIREGNNHLDISLRMMKRSSTEHVWLAFQWSVILDANRFYQEEVEFSLKRG